MSKKRTESYSLSEYTIKHVRPTLSSRAVVLHVLRSFLPEDDRQTTTAGRRRPSIVVLFLVQLADVEVGLLAVNDGVEPAVLVSLVLDRPDGAVRLYQRVEPGHHVAGSRLVLALHVAGVRVVHVVVERIVHRFVFVFVSDHGLVVVLLRRRFLLLLHVPAVRIDRAVRGTLRPHDQTEHNAQLHRCRMQQNNYIKPFFLT